MQAGRMKAMLRLYEPVRTVNAYGEETVTYTATVTVHAERVRFSGHRSEQVSEHFPDYSAAFNIRDAHRVEENWRAEQLGGHLYTVAAIEPNRDRGMLTLFCDRVNE